MAGAIEEFADVAEEVRSRYRHFVVDEYQDVSPLQQRLVSRRARRVRTKYVVESVKAKVAISSL